MNRGAVVREELALRRKLAVLEYARLCEIDAKAYRSFEVPRSSFYRWKKAFAITWRWKIWPRWLKTAPSWGAAR